MINPWRDFSVGAKEMVDQSGAACDNRAAQPGGRRRRFGVYEVVVVDDEIAVADMHGKPLLFVDHGDVVVFVHDINGDVFGAGGNFDGVGQRARKLVARRHRLRWLGCFAVYRDQTAFKQPLYRRAGIIF